MNITKENKAVYQLYSSMFSPVRFRKFVENKDFRYIIPERKNIINELTSKTSNFQELYSYIYKVLLTKYRNEYVYKNTIINKLLIGKYSLNTSTIINEFRIGKSIADLVLLNGHSRVFEIKTELDNLSRYKNQISDYRKVFQQIYIVTHENIYEKILKEIDSEVGLIILSKNNTLKTVREAIHSEEYLDNIIMLKSLRKDEYVNIIKKYYGYIPITTPMRFYSKCKDLISYIPTEFMHKFMVEELKKRTINEKKYFLDNNIVQPELKCLFWKLNFNKKQYEKYTEILNEPFLI